MAHRKSQTGVYGLEQGGHWVLNTKYWHQLTVRRNLEMHLSSKNEQDDIRANGVLTMRVKNASCLSENTTTLGSGKETSSWEAEAKADNGSANTAAMKGSLKSIWVWRMMKREERPLGGQWEDHNLLESSNGQSMTSKKGLVLIMRYKVFIDVLWYLSSTD